MKMGNNRRTFTKMQWREIRHKMIKKKRLSVDSYRRLQVLDMRYRGKSNREISEDTGFSVQYITELVAKYISEGMDAIIIDKRTSNNRRMSFSEEALFLEEFVERAEAGLIITVSEILKKFEEKTGKESNTSTIYKLLKRHGWRKVKPRPRHPGKATDVEIELSKDNLKRKFTSIVLLKNRINDRNKSRKYKNVRLMFADEAGFGRITDPASCWAPPKVRPAVPFQRIRQYKTVYGAVSPVDGESHYEVLDKSNTENMSIFLKSLSEKFPDDLIILCVDNASWHKSTDLIVPGNIFRFYLPPRTPEMNPIETIWREIRKLGFKNKVFDSIDAVVAKFNEVVNSMTKESVIFVTLRGWIEDVIRSFPYAPDSLHSCPLLL